MIPGICSTIFEKCVLIGGKYNRTHRTVACIGKNAPCDRILYLDAEYSIDEENNLPRKNSNGEWTYHLSRSEP